MVTHVLRNFLYLDTQLVDDYLSALEGALYDETIVEREEKIGGGSLGANIGPVQGSGKKEYITGVEVTKQVRMTDSAKFQRLYKHLESEEAFGYYEVVTKDIWDGFDRNMMLEAIVTLRFSNMDGIIGMATQMGALANVIEAATGQSLVDDQFAEAMKGFSVLEQLQQSKGIPCVMTFIGSLEYKLVAHLNPNYLKVPKEQIIGELNVFCKIQRKLGKNEKIELVELLPGLANLNLNRKLRRTMPKNAIAPPEIKDTVKGPAAVVIPIAIFR